MKLFSSKGQTLLALKNRVTASRIPDLVCISRKEWDAGNHSAPGKYITASNLIIRSSAVSEDSAEQSMAGQYLSIPNVNADDTHAVQTAIDHVFSSYADTSPQDEVIIQEMISTPLLSGVLFTRHNGTGAPFYVIDYDDETESTDSITSGKTVVKSLLVWRNAPIKWIRSERMKRILECAKEIQELCAMDDLDIEFVMDRNGDVWTLQVRPITTLHKYSLHEEDSLQQQLTRTEDTFRKVQHERKGSLGTLTLFGDMPDWNPAEMIGVHPFPLAFSLYQELITSRVWRDARHGMGYRQLPDTELMHAFNGRPYIDMRASFTSYLPADLPEAIGHKLVDAWIDFVKRHPENHDKVEFNVVTTCYTPRFMEHMQERYKGLLTNDELSIYQTSLCNLTNNFILGTCEYSVGWCETMGNKLKTIHDSKTLHEQLKENGLDHKKVIHKLLEQCRKMGTLPFAAMARHAFVAENLLRELLSVSVLTSNDEQKIRHKMNLVTSDIISKMADVKAGILTPSAYMKEYGHIRPSTYDIQSFRYDAMPELLENDIIPPKPHVKRDDTDICEESIKHINKFLTINGYAFDFYALQDYALRAIAGREYLKMIFTRDVSDILELVALWGQSYQLDREALSYAGINDILNLPDEHIPAEIKKNREKYALHAQIISNYLLGEISDIYVVPLQRSKPNFVTKKRLTAPKVEIPNICRHIPDIRGKIVCIERADPGFDWIFGHEIAGLVTKYGGSNSHMTIRCAEYDIPAAIGCGEIIYNKLTKGTYINMDCKSEYISAL